MDIVRLTGYVFAANTASRRVLEKNGFVLEGVMRQALYKNGQLQDDCIYAKYRCWSALLPDCALRTVTGHLKIDFEIDKKPVICYSLIEI